MKTQKTPNSQSSFKRENKALVSHTLISNNLYCKVTVIKTVLYWYKNRHTDVSTYIKTV